MTDTNRLTLRSYVSRSIAAGIISTIINLAVFFIGSAAGVFPEKDVAPPFDTPIIAPVVLLWSFVAAFVGVAIYSWTGSMKKFSSIAMYALVLSFGMPYLIADVKMSTMITLDIMHIVSWVVILGAAGWNRPDAPEERSRNRGRGR